MARTAPDLEAALPVEVDPAAFPNLFKTKWDLVNAITAQARKYKDLARLRYEVVGGDILGLKFKAEKKVEKEEEVKN